MSRELLEADAYEAALRREMARRALVGGIVFVPVGVLFLVAWWFVPGLAPLGEVGIAIMAFGAVMLSEGARRRGWWPRVLDRVVVSFGTGEDDGGED